MKFRNLIFVMTIAFSVIFASMIGTSYAYYALDNGVPISVTTSDMNTAVAVVFEQSQYINNYTGVPISEGNVDNLASSSVFTLNPDNALLEGYEVAVNIGIVDLYIDNELIISDFKYKFVCNDGTRDVITKNGNGTDFDEDVINAGYLKLGTLDTVNETFSFDKDYTCTLKIWLQNNSSVDNQNELMHKQFRGLIKVNTLFKK